MSPAAFERKMTQAAQLNRLRKRINASAQFLDVNSLYGNATQRRIRPRNSREARGDAVAVHGLTKWGVQHLARVLQTAARAPCDPRLHHKVRTCA
jgi:hypothetical protein